MPRSKLATPAKLDLVEVLEYLLEQAGGRVALKIERDLRLAFRTLAGNPGLGHKRPDITPKPLLFSTVGSYVVCYRADADAVVFVAILHGSRDIGSVLMDRPI